jgi:large subunit ribosomal protein L24
MMRIKTNDTVMVISGEDRGVKGKVQRVNRDEGKLVVEGVNRVYKHVRRSQKNPQGGRLSMEMPISVSNVLLVCGSCGAATRLGARRLADGSKERYCKKCGAGNGLIAPAKAKHAKK